MDSKESKKQNNRIPFYKQDKQNKRQSSSKQKEKPHSIQRKKPNNDTNINKKEKSNEKKPNQKEILLKTRKEEGELLNKTKPKSQQNDDYVIQSSINEKPKQNNNELNNISLNELNSSNKEFNKRKLSINQNQKKNSINKNIIPSNRSLNSDIMKSLKYSICDEETKIRMSKKQRKIQYGESTLGSFMTYDDKMSIINKDYKRKSKTSNNKNQIINNNLLNNINPKKKYVAKDLRILGAKPKKLSRVKKAIYLSRLQKKNYLLLKILNNDIPPKATELNNVNNENNEDLNKDNINDKEKEIKEISNCNNNLNAVISGYNNISLSANYIPFKFRNMNYSSNPTDLYLNINKETQDKKYFFNNDNKSQINYDDNIVKKINNNLTNEEMKKMKKIQKNKQYRQRKKEKKKLEREENKDENISNVYFKEENLPKEGKFLFESLNEKKTQISKEDKSEVDYVIKDLLKQNSFTKDEMNKYLKDNKKVEKININTLNKIASDDIIQEYIKKYEGLNMNMNKNTNLNSQHIREYVDQELSKELDNKMKDFIIKLRDLYYKKKEKEPLKAKKRFVVGCREVEKYLKLEYVKLVIIVPNMEKVFIEDKLDLKEKIEFDEGFSIIEEKKEEECEEEDEIEEAEMIGDVNEKANISIKININKKKTTNKTVKSSNLDDRLYDIIVKCREKKIPIYYGMNKLKLGKAARKKHSSVSIFSFINIEGFDQEFKDLISEIGKLRSSFYRNNKKEDYIDNRYIDIKAFDELEHIDK